MSASRSTGRRCRRICDLAPPGAWPCYNASMRQVLRLHPDSLCDAATRIEVEVARSRAGSLAFSYFVTGTIGDLRIPPITAAARTEELWQTTCFEAFIRASANGAYYELNFAP